MKRINFLCILIFIELLVGCGDNHQPVILSFTAVPTVVSKGEKVTLEVVATDLDEEDLSYDWNVEEGEIKGHGSKVTWLVPNATGDYTAKITVRDVQGASDTEEVTIKVGVDSEYDVRKCKVDREGRCWVYKDSANVFIPYAWMPEEATDILTLNMEHNQNPYDGEMCIRVKVKWREPWWAGIGFIFFFRGFDNQYSYDARQVLNLQFDIRNIQFANFSVCLSVFYRKESI